MESITFFGLPDSSWSAISSIATVAAVAVALLLPMLTDRRKARNIRLVVDNELRINWSLLKTALACHGSGSISKESMMCAVLKDISTHTWEESRISIAELRPRVFMKYVKVNADIQKLRMAVIDISDKKGDSLWLHIIHEMVKKCSDAIEGSDLM